MERKSIENAVEALEPNLDNVARVYEWAGLMGYTCPKVFSRHFLRHFGQRPLGVLTKVRIKSIIGMLRKNKKSCARIAWEHSMPDEKALNRYTNRHLGLSPRRIKELPANKLESRLDKTKSKTEE